jgi:hypothetical protein
MIEEFVNNKYTKTYHDDLHILHVCLGVGSWH